MSQRRSLKKGLRPQITILSAQPMSSSGAKDITYFPKSQKESPKVRAIDHNQSLVLGIDLPHPPRSAPPPRPAEPAREKPSKPDRSPKQALTKPSPPLHHVGSSPITGRIQATRPAPPKPVGPKRTQSLGKASDTLNHAIAVTKRTAVSQTTDNITDIGSMVSDRKSMPPVKPPRPKSEIIRHNWSSAVQIEDIDDFVKKPSVEPSTSPIADEDSILCSTVDAGEAILASLPNGTMNRLEDVISRPEKEEEAINGKHSPKTGPPKKPARPTIITAAAKAQARKIVPNEQLADKLADVAVKSMENEQVRRHVTKAIIAGATDGNINTLPSAALGAGAGAGAGAGITHMVNNIGSEMSGGRNSEAASSGRPPKPGKPQLPSKAAVPEKKIRPAVPTKPSVKSTQAAAAALVNGHSGVSESSKSSINGPSNEVLSAIERSKPTIFRKVPKEESADTLIEADGSPPAGKSSSTRVPPSRPSHGPSPNRPGTIKKTASLDQGTSQATPQSQLPYSSHPERGLRNRAATAPKVPVKPRRTKSLHRRPSISPPSTPPPPPREEVEMLLSGTVSANSMEPQHNTVENGQNTENRPNRPVPPQRVSSIDNYDNKMAATGAATGRRSSLQGASILDGIVENEHEEVRRKPVRPAPPKPVRSHTISTPQSNGRGSVVRRPEDGLRSESTATEHESEEPPLDSINSQNGAISNDDTTTSVSPRSGSYGPNDSRPDWEAEAKFTGPILSPGAHKDVFWAENTITEFGRVTGAPNLPPGVRIRDSTNSCDTDVGSSSPPLPRQGPVCTPTRPAPPKPSCPPNRGIITEEGRSPVSVGESSMEARTDTDGSGQELRRGSVRNPLRPAPPRPQQVARHKSVSEADYSDRKTNPNATESNSESKQNILYRSHSVKSPTRPAPPPEQRRKRSNDVSRDTAPGDGSVSMKATPPPRPSTLPVKPTHVTEANSGHTPGHDDWDGRERTGSGLMDKIHKNMEVTGPHAVALYDYQTGDEADLSFQVGDVIILKERINGEWLRGSVEDETGMFPSNFVEVIVDLEPSESLYEDENTALKVEGVDICKPHAVALQSYVACKNGELSFEAGDTIELIKKENDFYQGSVHGNIGLFPVSFVAVLVRLPSAEEEPISSTEESENKLETLPHCRATFAFQGDSAEDLSFEEGDTIQLVEKVNEEWYRGEIQGRIGMFPVGFVDILVDLPAESTPAEIEAQEAVENSTDLDGLAPQAKGLFDFQAMDEGELSFKTGDLIKLRRRTEDDWYEGEINGNIGIFPAGFVEVLTPLPLD